MVMAGVALLALTTDLFGSGETLQKPSTAAPPAAIAGDSLALGEYYFNQPPYSDGQIYDLDKARHHYNQSIVEAIRQGDAPPKLAWYQLARIDFVEGKYDGSISKLNQQLLVHADALPQTYYMLGLAYGYRALETDADSDWQAAEDGFKTFMEFSPQAPWPRVDLAWIYFAQGKYESMLPILETGLEFNGEHAWLLNTYGLALLNTGDTMGARQALRQAQQSYEALSVQDWERAYSGNDPQHWNRNFELFGDTIAYNLSLAEET